ncbi:hypothetical protein HDU89_006551 [Geranomyces variabilis]|nr:hypothetical protein HDU89_006551 [Geranomyces variabilis]
MSSQLTDREKKKRDEQNVKQLQELLTLPENQACADCNERGPRWASTNLGCFLCIRCGGLHRKLGTHISKIKSVTLDSWSPEQIEFMKQWGNKKANEKFLAGGAPPPPSHSDQEMEQYVRNKYERRNFQTPGGASRQSNESFSRDANAYATQIRTLRGMGFDNDQLSIAALKRANGNVGATIELLVSGQQTSASNKQPESRARERSEPISASTTQQGGRNPANATALASLRAMGFTNEEENITVLNATGGNLENAANRLLDAKHRREADQTQASPSYSESGPGFALEPPASASRGQRGAASARQAQQPDLSAQQNKSNDPFGGDLFDLNTPAVAPVLNQQSEGQQRSELDAFGGVDASANPQTQVRGVSKDNIMSLFNNAQRGGGFGQHMGGQHMGGGFGGPMMPHQQQNFGAAQNNFGGQQQFQQFQPQFQQANPQQFGGQPAGGTNPFGHGNFQAQQHAQPQQPAYTYMNVQNNVLPPQPFALGVAQAQPRNVGQGFGSPFGQQQQQQQSYGQQQQPFAQAQYGQQQAQQANAQRQPQQPDPFADLGPSLKGSQPVAQGQRKQ